MLAFGISRNRSRSSTVRCLQSAGVKRAHELKRLGRPVCERLGAAADFIVEDESMLEVAQWVVANTPFDRLYFYGDDKPIHVSFGPNHDRQVVRMVVGGSGKRIPRVMPSEEFLAVT